MRNAGVQVWVGSVILCGIRNGKRRFCRRGWRKIIVRELLSRVKLRRCRSHLDWIPMCISTIDLQGLTNKLSCKLDYSESSTVSCRRRFCLSFCSGRTVRTGIGWQLLCEWRMRNWSLENWSVGFCDDCHTPKFPQLCLSRIISTITSVTTEKYQTFRWKKIYSWKPHTNKCWNMADLLPWRGCRRKLFVRRSNVNMYWTFMFFVHRTFRPLWLIKWVVITKTSALSRRTELPHSFWVEWVYLKIWRWKRNDQRILGKIQIYFKGTKIILFRCLWHQSEKSKLPLSTISLRRNVSSTEKRKIQQKEKRSQEQ